ncbi:hypothetical protein GW17_00016998 [Ensete ventricosum]|nr:hypothetical protein GW17_00016998 [Ensete ventricosum]
MHPLRFPNNGIRVKVFMRKIGFKLHVMRLNHVESFYMFLLRFRSKGSEKEGRPAPIQGWLPTTRPWPGPARKGGRHRSWGQQPAGAAIAHGHTSLQRGARRGLPPMTNPTASHRGGCPLAGWLPTGKGSHRLRRGSSDGIDGARGVRTFF